MSFPSSNADDKTGLLDICIIGGGVNGCGIARDCAGRGLSVVLLEADDLASGTSSASTKLVHGGLRYLEQYEFLLVRKALKEREVLLSIAPHIIEPLRIVLPHNPSLRPRWMIRLGLFLYDILGGRKLLKASRQLDLRTDVAGKALKKGFAHAFEYADCRVDDSRLVVLNAVDAAQRGAQILTRHEMISAERHDDHWQVTATNKNDGTTHTARARILINAAGPEVAEIISERIMLDTTSKVRKVKGSHIVVPALFDHDRAYMFQNADNRIIFAIPYQSDFTLIGTTDVDITDCPQETGVSAKEIDYLCGAASEYFARSVSPREVVWSYSGIRPLYDDGEQAAQEITRDYVLELKASPSQPPILSVFGGKITTYRVLAEAVLEKLEPWLPNIAKPWTHAAPLAGGDFEPGQRQLLEDELLAQFSFLDASLATRLTKAYGTLAQEILAGCQSVNDLGLWFGADLYEKEVAFLVSREWARTATDIVWRRSKTGLFMAGRQIDFLEDWLKKNIASLLDQ